MGKLQHVIAQLAIAPLRLHNVRAIILRGKARTRTIRLPRYRRMTAPQCYRTFESTGDRSNCHRLREPTEQDTSHSCRMTHFQEQARCVDLACRVLPYIPPIRRFAHPSCICLACTARATTLGDVPCQIAMGLWSQPGRSAFAQGEDIMVDLCRVSNMQPVKGLRALT